MSKFPVIDMQATGRRIAQLRKEAGLSVRDVQEELELTSPQAVYKWQYGQSLPTIENMIMLSKMFHTDIEGLLSFEYDREQETGESRSFSFLKWFFGQLNPEFF